MSASSYPVAALVLAASLLLAAASVRAQGADHALLSTFCAAGDIKGSTCKRARGYPDAGSRGCDVKLSEDRYQGRFVAAGNPLLVVAYESGCEAHATDNGGAAVFEQSGSTLQFRGFQPGMQTGDCVVVANRERDLLVCLTGHMGQGILESGVALMNFARDHGGRIGMSADMLLTAEDSVGAYGSNVVTCKEPPPRYFELSKLRAGPRPNTVAVEATYADAAIRRTACGKGFPKPKETFGTLAPGDAYVPQGHEKAGTFIIDLDTRKVAPQG